MVFNAPNVLNWILFVSGNVRYLLFSIGNLFIEECLTLPCLNLLGHKSFVLQLLQLNISECIQYHDTQLHSKLKDVVLLSLYITGQKFIIL